MKVSNYPHLIILLSFFLFSSCEEKVDQQRESSNHQEVSESAEAGQEENSKSNTGPVTSSAFLDWLPMNYAGFSREKEPSTDYGDLPRVQVRYIHDQDSKKQFTLDVLDGKGPLIVAVTGMIKTNLGEEYNEPLLDGYAKVYQKEGVKAFERHTPADRKSFLQYAIDDRFYFNFKGENVAPEIFWEFKKVLIPTELKQ
ncbi:hypothetical protein ACPUEN_05890 [Algoriphagus yeomjeoni]|uniref:hypothetical protein n=1 Tax=Algoriphagus yeomjeoni TaxID=291403 RepID=UPI003CE58729